MKACAISHADLRLDGKLFRGRGCGSCFGSGFEDRTGIYEILAVDDHVRDQIMARSSASTIKREALKRGFRTLRMDGAQKVCLHHDAGQVLRVTQRHVLARPARMPVFNFKAITVTGAARNRRRRLKRASSSAARTSSSESHGPGDPARQAEVEDPPVPPRCAAKVPITRGSCDC
jgi:hypothetical protein